MTSSASVERDFSLLNLRFSYNQQRALNDYEEASLKISYNENFSDGLGLVTLTIPISVIGAYRYIGLPI